MNLNCIRCGNAFEHEIFIGYCTNCQSAIRANRQGTAERKQAAADSVGAVCVVGKFTSERLCPKTVVDPSHKSVCGLCGSDAIEMGYGFAGGYGMGSYNFCCGCGGVLDFSEDSGE